MRPADQMHRRQQVSRILRTVIQSDQIADRQNGDQYRKKKQQISIKSHWLANLKVHRHTMKMSI